MIKIIILKFIEAGMSPRKKGLYLYNLHLLDYNTSGDPITSSVLADSNILNSYSNLI